MDAHNHNKSSDQVIAEMVEMGFEHSTIVEAIRVVGPSIPSAVEHIFNTTTSRDSEPTTTHTSKLRASNGKALKKRALSSSLHVPKSRKLHHYFQSTGEVTEKKNNGGVVVVDVEEEHKEPLPQMGVAQDLDIASDWEQRVSILLQKHFGFSSLKSFQKEALSAWVARRDCLVLAATGSGFVLYLLTVRACLLCGYCAPIHHNYVFAGKSLCFQIPALLTGKVVVVISPLISLMHDQCLKLTKHGISACFLGSGQPDGTVEKKAMRGTYSIIYVCPETVLRYS